MSGKKVHSILGSGSMKKSHLPSEVSHMGQSVYKILKKIFFFIIFFFQIIFNSCFQLTFNSHFKFHLIFHFQFINVISLCENSIDFHCMEAGILKGTSLQVIRNENYSFKKKLKNDNRNKKYFSTKINKTKKNYNYVEISFSNF